MHYLNWKGKCLLFTLDNEEEEVEEEEEEKSNFISTIIINWLLCTFEVGKEKGTLITLKGKWLLFT